MIKLLYKVKRFFRMTNSNVRLPDDPDSFTPEGSRGILSASLLDLLEDSFHLCRRIYTKTQEQRFTHPTAKAAPLSSLRSASAWQARGEFIRMTDSNHRLPDDPDSFALEGSRGILSASLLEPAKRFFRMTTFSIFLVTSKS